jgi:hypothetical protein
MYETVPVKFSLSVTNILFVSAIPIANTNCWNHAFRYDFSVLKGRNICGIFNFKSIPYSETLKN